MTEESVSAHLFSIGELSANEHPHNREPQRAVVARAQRARHPEPNIALAL